MAIKINVTPTELVSISGALSSISEQFMAEVKSMYNTLDNLVPNWKSEGATDYYNKILSRKEEVEAIGKVIDQYATFTKGAARVYDETDSDIASAAKSNL